MSDQFYGERMRETLAGLSGGKVTELPDQNHQESAQRERLTAREILPLHPPLSGSHTVTRTVRGSWEPLNERQPIDWGSVPEAWTRGPDGRFQRLEPPEDE
jgi:hypothetical protein